MVYQACNWLYLGIGALRSHPDWIPDFTPDKRRYVLFEGSQREKRDLRRALKYPLQPYPRRSARTLGASRLQSRPASLQGRQRPSLRLLGTSPDER